MFNLNTYIANFHQLNETQKKDMANRFAVDLIEIAEGRMQLMAATAYPALTGQQLSNFLNLIFYVAREEHALNQQINQLRQYINNGANNNAISSYDINPTSNQHTYDDYFYDDYFAYKQYRIFSPQPDQQALFSLKDGKLEANETVFGSMSLEQAFLYVESQQKLRVSSLARMLSQRFYTFTRQAYTVLASHFKDPAKAEIWRTFLDFASPSAQIQNAGIFWFHIALLYQDAEIFSKWLSLGVSPASLNANEQQQALQLSFNKNHGKLLALLMFNGLMPSEIQIKNASEAIQSFLHYRPGKKYESIKEHASLSGKDLKIFNRMLEDENDSTDGESSDEEEDTFQLVNQNIKGGELLYRGTHYSPSYFKTLEDRKTTRELSYHQKPTYSRATQDLAKKINNNQPNYEHADQLIKAYFELLKLSPDKPSYEEDYKKRRVIVPNKAASFETLYYRFIQAYVNSYDQLFKKGEMARCYNFYSNENPLLSTIKVPEVAIKFASGECTIGDRPKFVPRVRKSTGSLKHRRLGYVVVYLVPKEYYAQHAANIEQLGTKRKIALHPRRHMEEVVIESSIPAEFVLGYQIFSLPKINDLTNWSQKIQTQYGLNKRDYDDFKNRLVNNYDPLSTTDIERILGELITSVTKTQVERLYAQVNLKLKQINAANNTRTQANPSAPKPAQAARVSTQDTAINTITAGISQINLSSPGPKSNTNQPIQQTAKPTVPVTNKNQASTKVIGSLQAPQQPNASPSTSQQLGWNCFDLAVGLEEHLNNTPSLDPIERAQQARQRFVDFAISKANEEKYRQLLAPEIRHAACLTAIYLNLKDEQAAQQQTINQNIIDLFQITWFLEKQEDRDIVMQEFLKLTNQEAEQPEELNELRPQTLPTSMHNQKLKDLVNNYTNAHEKMREAVAACNRALGKPEGQSLSLEGLDLFFHNENHRQQHKQAYDVFIKARKEIFEPHEQAFNNYCTNRDTYHLYVKDYYGQKNWFAFNRGFAGEQAATSMVDIAALYLGKQIIVSQKDGNSLKEIYRTKNTGPAVHIEYLNNNHFIKPSTNNALTQANTKTHSIKAQPKTSASKEQTQFGQNTFPLTALELSGLRYREAKAKMKEGQLDEAMALFGAAKDQLKSNSLFTEQRLAKIRKKTEECQSLMVSNAAILEKQPTANIPASATGAANIVPSSQAKAAEVVVPTKTYGA